MRRLLLGALAASAAVAAAACGGDGDGYGTGNNPNPNPTGCAGQGAAVVVNATSGRRFSPDSILITTGQTVCWQNTSTLSHTVTSDTGTVLNGSLGSGAIYVKTFTAAGTVPYHCIPHQADGMVGKVVIQ
ncbi:MAG: cupredoxin domain-containing protein [Gemmatimonadales bacterium]